MRRVQIVFCILLVLSLVTGCAAAPKLKESLFKENVTQPHGQTAPSTEATDQTTAPSEPIREEEGIDSDTRAELEKLDTTNISYGPGSNKDENGRPYTPMELNEQYAMYDAWFIGPDDGCIYLTFDLGWENEGLTHRILDTLQEKDVKAVFFVLMDYVEDNPDIIQRIIDEGHMLASHAYSHTTLAELSVDEIQEQIWKLHTAIREEYGYEMTLFRPPSGEFSQQVLGVAHALGYRTVNWSYAYVDWLADEQPNVEASYNRLMNAAHSGCIYLLHTVSTTNAALLGDLIDGLRQEGYRFALFTENTGDAL